jgi:hypothetical protein
VGRVTLDHEHARARLPDNFEPSLGAGDLLGLGEIDRRQAEKAFTVEVGGDGYIEVGIAQLVADLGDDRRVELFC